MTTMIAVVMALGITTTLPQSALAQEVFESEEGGFRFQVPEGWVVQDLIEQLGEEVYHDQLEATGSSAVVTLCKENEALPAVGGVYNCFGIQNTGIAGVDIYPNLHERPVFQRLIEEQNKTITTSDIVAMDINDTQYQNGAYDVRIQDSIDIDENRKIVQTSFKIVDDAGTLLQPFDDQVIPWIRSSLFVLSEDKDTAYIVVGPPIFNPVTGFRTEDGPAME